MNFGLAMSQVLLLMGAFPIEKCAPPPVSVEMCRAISDSGQDESEADDEFPRGLSVFD